jgi:hypothetical protein
MKITIVSFQFTTRRATLNLPLFEKRRIPGESLSREQESLQNFTAVSGS